MFARLKQLLQKDADEDPEPRLELIIQDLENGIQTIKSQYQQIANQESELLTKLQAYYLQHKGKIDQAKLALSSGDELNAEGFYKESEIINQQIIQYKGIILNIQSTRQKLLTQENHFKLTKDQLIAKKAMGQASVDASQLKADLSEQLMILNESDELSKFDTLIEEATTKSQAIEEIQGEQGGIDEFLENSNQSALNGLENLIKSEKEEKLKTSRKNQQLLIARVFGEIQPVVDQTQNNRKKTLLEKLKYQDFEETLNDPVSNFFDQKADKELSSEKNDRVDNFFKEDQQDKDNKQSIINQFFTRNS